MILFTAARKSHSQTIRGRAIRSKTRLLIELRVVPVGSLKRRRGGRMRVGSLRERPPRTSTHALPDPASLSARILHCQCRGMLKVGSRHLCGTKHAFQLLFRTRLRIDYLSCMPLRFQSSFEDGRTMSFCPLTGHTGQTQFLPNAPLKRLWPL